MADHGQQHPIAIYFWVWGLLFVLSTASYMVMHMMWERMAMIYAILVPPLVLIVLVGLMAGEADYTFLTRMEFFTGPRADTILIHLPPFYRDQEDWESNDG